MEKIGNLPKWAVLAIGGVLVLGLGYGMYYLSIGSKKPKETAPEQVIIDMPDAPVDKFSTTAMNAFEDEKSGKSKVDDYWNSLGGGKDDIDVSLPGSTSPAALDPTVYTELEIFYIQNGIKSKEEIDRQHAEDAARAAQEEKERRREEEQAARSRPKPLTQAQQDSLYFARLEKAYAIAAKHSGAGQAVPEPEPEPEPEERRIDLDNAAAPSSLPTEVFGDGIVTSLDEPSLNGIVSYGGKSRSLPVKATFLKNERLVSGNRVIMRLMQDLILSDGTVIPQNTHITGTCTLSRRLQIKVTMLHYGGRMFPVDISVYDNDGTEGIYCPMVDESRSKASKAKKVAGDMLSGAGSLVGTMVTGNPLVGSVASRGLSSSIQSVTSAITDDGNVAIDVTAGYEFYVYENVKDNDGKS